MSQPDSSNTTLPTRPAPVVIRSPAGSQHPRASTPKTTPLAPRSPAAQSSRHSHKHSSRARSHASWHAPYDEEKRISISPPVAAHGHSTGSSMSSLAVLPGSVGTLSSLLYLSTAAPFLSAILAIAAFNVTFVALLAAPFRTCFKASPTLSIRLSNWLWPLISLHHHCVSSVPFATSQTPTPPSSPNSLQMQKQQEKTGSTGITLVVLLLSPLLALPFALASGIVACFWVLSATVRDPRQRDPYERHPHNEDDGRMLARVLTSWWIKWLDGGR